jgi:hypothetical protein
MVDLKEKDEGHRTAEHFLQYVVVDPQGPFPISIRGYRYWFAVLDDVCTKLKLSFGAPTLVAGMKTQDYVLTRECNRVNKDVDAVFQLVGEPRKLDEEAAPDGRVPDKDVDEARKKLAEHLS